MRRSRALAIASLISLFVTCCPAYSQQGLSVDQQIALGEAVFAHGDYEAAVSLWRAALVGLRKAGDKRGVGAVSFKLGAAYQSLGDAVDCLAAFRDSLAAHRELKNRAAEADDLTAIGTVEAESLGRYDDALHSLQRALALHTEFNEPLLEGADLDVSGIAEAALGRYDDALRSMQRSLAIFRRLKYRPGEADDLDNIGTAERELGRDDEALRSLRQALAVHHDIKDRQGEANDLNNIAALADSLDLAGDALRMHQQALAIHRQIKYRIGEALDLTNIGISQSDVGRNDDALTSLKQALKINRTIKAAHGEAEDLLAIGVIRERQGHYTDALGFTLASSALLHQLHDPENLWRALLAAASAEAHLNRRDAALLDYDAAIDGIEALRAGLAQTERSSFYFNKLFAYDEYIGYLEELNRQFPGQGYDRKALDILERKEARAVLEQIAGSSARRFQGVLPDVIAQDKATKAAVEFAQQRLAKSYGNAASAVVGAQAALDSATSQRSVF
jgi:tetratricopeptide (TPR) repeat protein